MQIVCVCVFSFWVSDCLCFRLQLFVFLAAEACLPGQLLCLCHLSYELKTKHCAVVRWHWQNTGSWCHDCYHIWPREQIISQIIWLSDYFVCSVKVFVHLCMSWMLVVFFKLLFVCSRLFLKNTSPLQLFQRFPQLDPPEEVARLTARCWVPNQSGGRVWSPRYSYLSTCPPQLSATRGQAVVKRWPHTHSLWTSVTMRRLTICHC